MKVFGIVVGCLLAVVLLAGGSLFLMYQSLHDGAISSEAIITQKDEESQNTLSRVNVSVANLVGNATAYSEEVKEAIKAAVEGRYGAKGSQAVFQMIQEHNPEVKSVLREKLADVITGGQKEFEISQTRKIEVCTAYRKDLGYLVKGTLLRIAGFPKVVMDKTCQVVTDAQTKDAFNTGLQTTTKMR